MDRQDKQGDGIRLLSLGKLIHLYLRLITDSSLEDGGGSGSLSQLRIIGEYMSRLAHDKRVSVDSVFPADLLDMIGGVGFGA